MESWKEQLKSKIHESELSVSEISDKTKIPSKYIDAIQEGKFQDLPAEIFLTREDLTLLTNSGLSLFVSSPSPS